MGLEQLTCSRTSVLSDLSRIVVPHICDVEQYARSPVFAKRGKKVNTSLALDTGQEKRLLSCKCYLPLSIVIDKPTADLIKNLDLEF